MEPSAKDIQDLRANFLKKLEENDLSSPDAFHPADINRVKNTDDWLKRFLLHHDNDQKEALNMLWETCDWRKKFGANDITEKNVNMSILENGSIFSHNKDKDGKTLLIFKSKKHFKSAHDFEELKRCLVYWMERLERQEKGDMISIFFDMDGAGLSNMDMEYTKYLIGLFKNYYPYYLNYILIFEMAWVLNAAFKIIKSWLPPKAVQKIKFLNKNNLKDYVDADQALKSWGGRDEYIFSFEPEQRNTANATPNDESKKKVHFADGSPLQEQLNESGFVDSSTQGSGTSISKLAITPSDVMCFAYEGNEMTGSILLKNEDTQCISYKIKTTSPEKFRVRPSTGTLAPGASVTVSVLLQPGYHLPGLARDKFLIMSIPVESTALSVQEVTDLWKQVSDREVQQHRLRCSVSQPGSADSALKNGSAFGTQVSDDQRLTKIASDVNKLQTHVSSLKEEMKVIQRQQWIVVIVVVVLACIVLYVTRNSGHSDAVIISDSCPLPVPQP